MCISIVASAFQYGWAPTLMPETTTLISPPSSRERARSAAAPPRPSPCSRCRSPWRSSRPADSANHSTGTPSSSARSSAAITRRHSGSASEPSERVGSPSMATRSMPSGWRSVRLRTSPTTMLASFVAAGRSTGTSLPSSSRSCSTNSPGGIVGARLRALGREQLDDLRGVDGPAPARRHDPRGALVEHAQRLGRRIVDLHHHAAAGGAEEAQHAVAAVAHAHAQLHELEPQLAAQAGVAGDDGARLLRVDLQRRPRVEHQPVPARPLARRAARLVRAHRLERLARHPLELGQRGDAAVGVEHRREVAHLGDRDEPLVALVLARDGAEQVDVGRRGQPLEREVRQPPEVEPLRHHRVQAAVVDVLGERAAAGRAREAGQLDRRRAPASGSTAANTTRATASGSAAPASSASSASAPSSRRA